MSISKNLFEEYYLQNYNQTKNKVEKEIVLINHKKLLEIDNRVNSQFRNSKNIIHSIRKDFSKSSFTINYVLLKNSVIITVVILSLWLLTLIRGFFNNFVVILGIILIVLILMVFESLNLLEKDITFNKDKK
jgi:preprotein translocase subunit SecD